MTAVFPGSNPGSPIRQCCESEGVLMIITYFGIIVFQLVERIAIAEKSIKSVLGHCIDMLGFSYNAIPTRHEVSSKPYLQEDII